MPDPNKRKPRVESIKQADASKTPKVRKDPKFTGTQKYGREFMCKVEHNKLTNDEVGQQKFKNKANASGMFVKKATQASKTSKFPTQSQGFLGGMTTKHQKRVTPATNVQRARGGGSASGSNSKGLAKSSSNYA